MSRVSAVISHPVIARVISVFLSLCTSIDDTELRGSSNKEHWGFICGTFLVGVDEVDEGWYPGEVNDLVVILETAWRIFSTCGIGKGIDSWYQIISLSFHGI
jgi:hypothetical protein